MRLWNPRSIRNKTTTCNDYISEHDVDAIFLVETWLATNDPVVIGELKPNGYTFLNIPRGTSNHGGIGFLSKAQLAFRLHPLNAKTVTFEHASILDPNNGVHYIIIYRPHPTKANGFTLNRFMEEFEDFLQEVSLLTGKLIMLGDFNFHMKEPHRSEVVRFQAILSYFGLNQHVTQATHISGNTLDLLLTPEKEDLVRLCDAGTAYGSDHYMVRFVLQQSKPPPLRVTSTLRDFRKVDPVALKTDLNCELNNSLKPKPSNVNDLLDHLEKAAIRVLDKHAPATTRSRRVCSRPPWYNDDLREEKRDLKQAIVTPILKKPNLDWNNLQNYRPVSNIAFIGKLIEKAAIIQINDHMRANELDELCQSAYKEKHSTETALLKVTNDIARAIDDNKAVSLIMLDLSAAFDTIDHDILFSRLELGFGIKGTVLQWFKSYISGRQFRVSVGG
ncbi:uncharacterized protein [Amphiura filiformis]|uniref:uncharacterized protein n=1 Tax=Amphiura filiformis TaxID=82378 RepID=UPI003B21139A